MKVKELIEFLKKQDQEMIVVYRCFSERDTLQESLIEIVEAGLPRPDGWIANKRPDKPSQKYLEFPGN